MTTITSIMPLFDLREKFALFYMLFLIIISSIIEMLGIASIMPFIGLFNDPTYLDNFDYFARLYTYFNLQPLMLITIAFMIFFISSLVFNMLTYWTIVKFCANYEYKLSTHLIKKYLNQKYTFFFNHSNANICKNIL